MVNIIMLYVFCFLLDPRYRGVGLSDLGIRRAVSLALSVSLRVFPDHDQEKLKDHLFCYLEKDAPFNDKHDWISSGPKFWNLSMEAPESHALGKLVMEYCPHAVSCEHHWSSHIMPHTKSHKRLKEDSVFKIAAIKPCLVDHKKLTKDAVFKKCGKIVDVEKKISNDCCVWKEYGGISRIRRRR
jgi:hypothetical protein